MGSTEERRRQRSETQGVRGKAAFRIGKVATAINPANLARRATIAWMIPRRIEALVRDRHCHLPARRFVVNSGTERYNVDADTEAIGLRELAETLAAL